MASLYADLPTPYKWAIDKLNDRTCRSRRDLILEGIEMLAVKYRIVKAPEDIVCEEYQ